MTRTHIAIPLLVVSLLGVAAPAGASPTFPDRGRAGVVDAAHVLPDAAREALNRRVVAWDRSTGHQLAVVTVPDMQGLDVKDYGLQLGRAWGLGDKQRKDGAILLLSMKERKVRIEVGYGLEPVLTDAATSMILADRVVPKLKAGDVPAALSNGADAIMAVASAEKAQPITQAGGGFDWHWLFLPVGAAIVGLASWIALTIQRGRRRYERIASEAAAQRGSAQRVIDGSLQPEHHSRSSYTPLSNSGSAQPQAAAPSPAAGIPRYTQPPYDPPPRRDDSSSSSSSSSSDSGSSSSSSSDSGSSSSGFDSGGGSFGGGGSDSSW